MPNSRCRRDEKSAVSLRQRCEYGIGLSAGLTMWQMWQMPRASGLRGASGSRENFFQPVSIQVI